MSRELRKNLRCNILLVYKNEMKFKILKRWYRGLYFSIRPFFDARAEIFVDYLKTKKNKSYEISWPFLSNLIIIYGCLSFLRPGLSLGDNYRPIIKREEYLEKANHLSHYESGVIKKLLTKGQEISKGNYGVFISSKNNKKLLPRPVKKGRIKNRVLYFINYWLFNTFRGKGI